MQPLIRAVVDTSALKHNLATIRTVAPRSRVMAVVKANAYGHGLVPVGRALAAAAADALAVARLDEGLTLRAAGLAQRILLLEGVFDAEQLRAAGQGRFDLCVHSAEQVQLLESYSGSHRFRVWIKIDTGMNRLGFRPEDFGSAYSRLARLACLEGPPTLVTHFANADERDDPKTAAQLSLFTKLTAGLPGERSLANSAGLFGWAGAQADWVRPGIATYGVSPFASSAGTDLGLRAAMTLESTVIALKSLAVGDTVGYGSGWRAARPTRLAVVAAGYGDGYPRNTASGTPVSFAAGIAPLVGRVSMDMITVDITDLPPVAVGESVTLWGSGVPVERVAQGAGTLAYELLCGVSQRVHLDVR